MARSLLRSLADFVITKVFPASKAHVLPRIEAGVRGPNETALKRLNAEETGTKSE